MGYENGMWRLKKMMIASAGMEDGFITKVDGGGKEIKMRIGEVGVFIGKREKKRKENKRKEKKCLWKGVVRTHKTEREQVRRTTTIGGRQPTTTTTNTHPVPASISLFCITHLKKKKEFIFYLFVNCFFFIFPLIVRSILVQLSGKLRCTIRILVSFVLAVFLFIAAKTPFFHPYPFFYFQHA